MKAILLQKELSNFLKQNGTESFSKLVFDSIIAVGGNFNDCLPYLEEITY